MGPGDSLQPPDLAPCPAGLHLLWTSEPDLDPASSPSHGEAIAFLLALSRASSHRRHQLQDFAVIDTAVKAVGVGSVGTCCAIALMKAPPRRLLLLQAALPPASTSSLEAAGHEVSGLLKVSA